MSLSIILAYILDECLGEPKRLHPLVGFGSFANLIETNLYSSNKLIGVILGGVAWCLAVIPIVVAAYFLIAHLPVEIHFIINGVVLYLTLGQNSLKHHGLAVYDPLKDGDISKARYHTSIIVSRDTSKSDECQLATATVETITENTNDAVIAPIFYFVVFGAAGALLFRLANTLDAMWGYRNEKYEYFGKVSARVDDILGFLPARITVLLFLIVRPTRIVSVINAVFGNGRKWYSPNAGIVMAAGAGALSIQLGGNAIYHGKEKSRLTLGFGQAPISKDIKSSITLMYLASTLFISLIILFELFTNWNIQGVIWP